MTTGQRAAAMSEPPAVPATRRRVTLRLTALLIALGVLTLLVVLSIAVGAKPIPLDDVVRSLSASAPDSAERVVVISLRLPRTVLGIAVGAALAMAGVLMQALTRNPLADPGLLGVNIGAAVAVVLAIWIWQLTTLTSYVWFAFAGAAIATVLVYLLGSQGRGGTTPVRLALAGTAVSAVLGAVVTVVTVLNPKVFDQFRFWGVGTLGGAQMSVVGQVLPFLLVGSLLALAVSGPLNALALGDETARALGSHVGRTRIAGAVAVTLLCGAATAAVGPIAFVGLTIPHIARLITGPDHRWLLIYAAVLGPILLLAADVLGRVVARPGEIQVGIVTAFVGAPVFVALVRRQRIAEL